MQHEFCFCVGINCPFRGKNANHFSPTAVFFKDEEYGIIVQVILFELLQDLVIYNNVYFSHPFSLCQPGLLLSPVSCKVLRSSLD